MNPARSGRSGGMRPRVLLADVRTEGAQALQLDADRSHHLVRVLRLKPGAALECFDGRGTRFDAWLETADPRACTIRLGEPRQVPNESPLRVTLAQCVCGGERMDWLIEKATELGVYAVQPLLSAHSPLRLDDQRRRRRHEHWQRLIEAACMQCGRDMLPNLHEIRPLEAWLGDDTRPRAPTAFVLAPGSDSSLRDACIEPANAIELLIGPEKGLTDAELASARTAGFRAVRLGPRVLRTETAGIAALAALQALGGDF